MISDDIINSADSEHCVLRNHSDTVTVPAKVPPSEARCRHGNVGRRDDEWSRWQPGHRSAIGISAQFQLLHVYRQYFSFTPRKDLAFYECADCGTELLTYWSNG